MDYLKAIEDLLDMPTGQRAEAMRELTSHFDELYGELRASGMSPVEARIEAERRMGLASHIARSLNATHNSASWKSATIAVVPYAAFPAVCLLSQMGLHVVAKFAFAVLGTVLLLGAGHEFLKGRRPIWLSTWLAALFIISSIALPQAADPLLSKQDRSWVILTAAAWSLAAATIAASLRARRWRRFVMPLGLVCFTLSPYVFSHNTPLSILVVFGSIALLMYFARCVFEVHPYGDGSRASLFVLALITLTIVAPDVRKAGPGMLVYAVTGLLCAGAVVWFSITPRRIVKQRAIAICLMLLILGAVTAGSVSYHGSAHSHSLQTIIEDVMSTIGFVLLLTTYIGIPISREQAERNRLKFAR